MSETLSFFLLQSAFLAVVLILHTYLGLHIIRRTLIFTDLVLDQLAALGALVALGAGIEYGGAASYATATVAVLIGAFLLAVVKPANPLIPREAVIGIMYAAALLASLLVGDKIPGGDTYVAKTLSGSVLWVSWPMVAVTAAVYAVLLFFHFIFRDKFISMTDRPGTIRRESLWDFLFFTTQGVITVLVVPIAGVLLAYAFLMIPAATAAMFTRGWGRALLLGWGVGFVACLAGLGLSYRFDLPYGPTLVLALGSVFVAAVFVRSVSVAGMNAGKGA